MRVLVAIAIAVLLYLLVQLRLAKSWPKMARDVHIAIVSDTVGVRYEMQTTGCVKLFYPDTVTHSSCTFKFFYKYARSQLKVKEMVTPIEDEQGNIVINDTFNNHFVTQFIQENLDRNPEVVKMFQGSSEEELNSITFEESCICNKLKKLNASKSPRTNKIFQIVLNRCAEELMNTLFTKSFQSGKVPQDWLDANVIPVYKKGHHSKPGNYWSVSLTSQVCKVMEFFLLGSISEHLKQHKLILDSQHGFRPKRSCLIC